MQIGYVGLGNRGGVLARRLTRDHPLRAHDPGPEVVAGFAADGAVPTRSPRSLAEGCDVVMTCPPIFQTAINEFGPEADVDMLIHGFENRAGTKVVDDRATRKGIDRWNSTACSSRSPTASPR